MVNYIIIKGMKLTKGLQALPVHVNLGKILATY